MTHLEDLEVIEIIKEFTAIEPKQEKNFSKMMNSKGKVSTLTVKNKAVLGLPLPAQNLKPVT